jgi:hypothetical protein
LFPPLRLEGFKLKVIKKEDEYKNNEASILIKDNNNIIIYLNEIKKGHKPIIYNLNDDVINTFSKKNVKILINNIIESLKEYPREYLFINSKNEQYTEDGLKKMLYDITKDKNIGVNALRSAYVSYYFNKLNKLQLERVAFLMRSTVGTLQNHYLKKEGSTLDEPEPEIKQKIKIEPEIKQKIKIEPEIKQKKLTDEQRDILYIKKNDYLKEYYIKNKEILLNKANEHSKNNYGNRLIRELNNNTINFKNMRAETVEKWNIKFNTKSKLYYI